MSEKKTQTFVHKIPNPVGRPSKVKNAEELWDKFVAYCDDVDENPWQQKTGSNSVAAGQKGGAQSNAMRQEVRVLPRPYTLQGFCAYCGIVQRWVDFKRHNIERRNFKEVITQIENVVMAQQLDGALLHQFNANIVARLNGLADKIVQEVTGKDGSDFKFPKLSLADIEELKKINEV